MQDNRTLQAKEVHQQRKAKYEKLLTKQDKERAALETKQAEERAALSARSKKGHHGGSNLRRVSEHENGRWVLYRRPWADGDKWRALSLSLMNKGKRVRMFTFGWDGNRLSQNGDTATLKFRYGEVYEWLLKICKRSL